MLNTVVIIGKYSGKKGSIISVEVENPKEEVYFIGIDIEKMSEKIDWGTIEEGTIVGIKGYVGSHGAVATKISLLEM